MGGGQVWRGDTRVKYRCGWYLDMIVGDGSSIHGGVGGGWKGNIRRGGEGRRARKGRRGNTQRDG